MSEELLELDDSERRRRRHTGQLEDDQYADERGQTKLERQIARLPALLSALDHQRLALELAVAMEPPSVTVARFGLSDDQALELLKDKAFAALLEKTTQDVKKHGTGFQMKAAAIAEDMLKAVYIKGTDPECSAKDARDILETTARLGRLEPPKVKDDAPGGGTGSSLNLTIMFSGAPTEKVVANAIPSPAVYENGE